MGLGVIHSSCWNLTDMTLADEDTNSIPTDDCNQNLWKTGAVCPLENVANHKNEKMQKMQKMTIWPMLIPHPTGQHTPQIVQKHDSMQ